MPLIVLALASSMLLAQGSAFTITGAARSVQPGEVIRLTIRTATPVTTLEAEAFGVRFTPYRDRVDENLWQVLVGIDLDVDPGRHTVSFVGTNPPETFLTTRTLVVEPKAFRTRRLTVEPRYVEPPAEVTDRIIREADRLNEIWESRTDRMWTEAFTVPVPEAANSAFGSRSVFNGVPRNPHGGTDFRSPAGRVVGAPAPGRIVLAEDLYFTGGTVVIDHGLGLVSLFAHLSAIDVEPGSVVESGQTVGRVGATGRVTGPHLHWTVRLNGARVDPLSLVEATSLPESARTNSLLP